MQSSATPPDTSNLAHAKVGRSSGLLSLLIVALGLCSCATPYQPAKSGKGYSETQVSSNEFDVSFRGNGQTDLERATDFVLLRSAQVAREHGFSHFAVMDSTNTSSAKEYTMRQRYYSPVSPETGIPVPGSLAYPSGYIVEYQEPRIYYQPGTTLRIKCFTARPEKPFTYDAAALQQTLKQKYHLR